MNHSIEINKKYSKIKKYSSLERRKKHEIDRRHKCPIEDCYCAYEEMKLLKRHFKIKHSDKLQDYPDLEVLKRTWRRPAGISHPCIVIDCYNTYSSKANLQQHMRIEHKKLYNKIKKRTNKLNERTIKTKKDLNNNLLTSKLSNGSTIIKSILNDKTFTNDKTFINNQKIKENDLYILTRNNIHIPESYQTIKEDNLYILAIIATRIQDTK